jgi:hypothetical protein
MTLSTNIQHTATLGGKNMGAESATVAHDGMSVVEKLLASAKAGTLSVRTDNDTGTLVMSSGGHGITTGARLDLYWLGGCRRGITVGTVSGTSVPIDGGSGDNLPTASTAITAMVPTEVDFGITGDQVQVVVAFTDSLAQGQVVFADASNAELHNVKLAVPNQMYDWYTGNGTTNPLAGDAVSTVFVSHGDATGSKTVRVGVGYNNL